MGTDNSLGVFGGVGCAAVCDGVVGALKSSLPLACMLGSGARWVEESSAFASHHG